MFPDGSLLFLSSSLERDLCGLLPLREESLSISSDGDRRRISVSGRPFSRDLDLLPLEVSRGCSSFLPEKGGGLGLAIVAKVAEAHGGQLQVDSELGRGTNITMTL